ncbi:HrpB1 family type III secretion system apparatus protein [Allochromatium palmeri]|uniref:Tetratricopeptide repeat protein n=1 Tax=Allochromatium palmeri TaxID=231048 RepID=A0A6N8EE33_9GAMM|nr:HrpB1 family type III secretion system apparatus protein [Allochromatium palmeri]MTW22495.1 hypothetical protein [Allochromatium palmeri]
MDIDEDLVRLLAELASIAGGRCLADQTEALVGALAVLRPDNERPYLIQALARLNLGDAEGAERILRDRALKTNPVGGMAMAYLGLVLHQQGRIAERDQVLRAALDSQDGDEDAARLARHLLNTAPA